MLMLFYGFWSFTVAGIAALIFFKLKNNRPNAHAWAVIND